MKVENLPNLGLPQLGDIRDSSRPVLSFDWSADAPHSAAAHAHPRAHIIVVVSGAYWVRTSEGTWLVPEGLAVWIPPMVEHQVYSHGAVQARILFVDETHAKTLPSSCGTVIPSDLLMALLEKIISKGNDYEPDGSQARLALVMLDELRQMSFASSPLPVSGEPRVARVMQQLIADPLSEADVETLARNAGASARTLARLFKAETGITLNQWRINLKLQEAIRRLATGANVTDVAFEFGYNSASAFAHMFRSQLGVPPRTYQSRRDAGDL
ncbi:MAG: AraC family transcriptional regulator [Paracoccaceae bacterium]